MRELVDLFAQRSDVVSCLTKCVCQFLVPRDGLGQLSLRIEQSLFEASYTTRGLLQPVLQRFDLVDQNRGALTLGGEFRFQPIS